MTSIQASHYTMYNDLPERYLSEQLVIFMALVGEFNFVIILVILLTQNIILQKGLITQL